MRVRVHRARKHKDELPVPGVQRKLRVGRADDPLEHEADRTASLVLQRLDSGPVTEEESAGPARRAPLAEETGVIGADGGEVDAATSHAITSSSGRALDPATRSTMESAFETDFSSVRIHTGPRSDALNDKLSSRAFTSGSNIFIRSGDYAPAAQSGQRLLAHELTHVVQQGGTARRISRLVMTDKQWIKSSTLVGKPRSGKLLLIDEALIAYNKGSGESPSNRLVLLEALDDAIVEWIDSKGGSDAQTGDIASKRSDAVRALRTKVDSERIRLVSTPSADDTVGSPTQGVTSHGKVKVAASDIYKRAVRQAHALLSKTAGAVNASGIKGAWSGYLSETNALMNVIATFDQTDARTVNANHHARALDGVVLGLAGLTYRYHGAELPSGRYSRERTTRVLDSHLGGLDATHQSADAVEVFIKRAKAEFIGLGAIAMGGDTGGTSDPFAFLDDDRGALIDELMEAVGTGTGIGGYFGTGGAGNEGFQEFAKKGAFVDALASRTDSAANDKLSGGMDMTGGLTGMGGDYLSVISAAKTLAQAKADPGSVSDADVRAAKATLASAPLSLMSNYLAFVGGAMTAKRGGGSIASTGFGFDATSPDGTPLTDASTDVKMAGDFAGIFAGIIDSIKKVLDVTNHFGDRSAKQKSGDVRKRFEDLGLFFKKVTGTLTSFANNAKALTKIGYQISGGGQVAQDAVNAAAADFMGKAVPGLNLVMGILEAVQQTYKLVRIGIRRTELTKRIEQVTAGTGDLAEVETMEFAHGTLIKRSTRIGINLGHALSSIASGAFNLSGIGAAPGMVISLASTAARVGQVGLRVGKQKGREKKAEKRAAKGKTESYSEWELKKKKQAAAHTGKGKRRFEQFKTAVNIKFTFNWDKTSENKAATVKAVALEAIRMDDPVVWGALGIQTAIDMADGPAAKMKIVMDALNKRD